MSQDKSTESKTNIITWIDLAVKILSTVIIAVFGLLLNQKATKITNSLKANEILQKLIEDLSTPESVNQYRKDLAFIVLQEIYDDDSLIIKISKCIYENDTNPVSVKNAVDLLSKKDPDYLIEKRTIQNTDDEDLKILDSIPTLIPVQKKDTSQHVNQKTLKLQENTRELFLKLTKSYNKVAIFYTNDGKNDDKLKEELNKINFDVLFRKKPDNSPDNEIIYVYEADELFAKKIKDIIIKKSPKIKITKSTKFSKIINKNQILVYL